MNTHDDTDSKENSNYTREELIIWTYGEGYGHTGRNNSSRMQDAQDGNSEERSIRERKREPGGGQHD